MIIIDSNILVETEFLGSNNSIVCTPEGVVCIDSPHRPSDAMAWRRVAEGCGEVLYLLNTDHHPDHTIGNYWPYATTVFDYVRRAMPPTALPSAMMTRQRMYDINPLKATSNKIERIRLLAPMYKIGMIHHNRVARSLKAYEGQPHGFFNPGRDDTHIPPGGGSRFTLQQFHDALVQ